MSKYSLFLAVLILFTSDPLQAETVPTTGRGIVALPHDNATVTVGWRLLASDPDDVAFNVYRQDLYAGPEYALLTPSPLKQAGTTFLDQEAEPGHSYRYRVQAIINGREVVTDEAAYLTALESERPYMSIALSGSYQVRSVGFGDLDGDGVLDYVVKQPDFNTDPYHRPRYWRRSKEPYTLEAYSGSDGKLLWSYNMGWAIETGAWYSPYVVYDLDRDGFAEVYTKAGEGDPRAIDPLDAKHAGDSLPGRKVPVLDHAEGHL
jgi:rhamnogalacturonan endolyase